MSTYDVENTNCTNKGRDLRFANKPWIVLRGTERMPQKIQRHRRATPHWLAHPQRMQDETEKSSYGVGWLQKGIGYRPAKLDNKLLPNVQDIRWSQTLSRKPWKPGEWNWQLEGKAWRVRRSKEVSPLLFVIAMMPLNHILRKCIAGYKLSKSQEKINDLMYMNDMKLFAKNEPETLIHAVGIYSQDIGMEFGIEKCAIKSGKRRMTNGMELPNQEEIKTLGEKKTFKYLGILEADTIRQVEMKEEIQKEYLRRTRKLLETKPFSRNLIKKIDTWAVLLVRYSGPIWSGPEKNLNKWTR